MSDDLASIRHQLLVLVRQKKKRKLDEPRDWRPYEVLDPETNQPFTTTGVWEYITQILEEENHPLEEVVQENPLGKKAYVMFVEMGEKNLYIKLRLGTGCVLGRSFHYSEEKQL